MPVAPEGSVLITGVTGFLGAQVLVRYLDRTDRHLYALVRARDGTEAASRLHSTLADAYGPEGLPPGRVTAVAADLEGEDLALPSGRRTELARSVTDIVHSAASVSFTLPLEDSRRINVEGTRHILKLAREAQALGGLNRFAYVSTAYVAGTHAGEFREDQLDLGQGFRNTYERSKFEAEQLVQDQGAALPVQIFRPSIIVGERSTGWTASFNVLYTPLKAFARERLRLLPARRSAPVDVVPVDFVADAIFALATRPVEGSAETFQLVAGSEATTVGVLAERAASHLRQRPPKLMPPTLYRRVVHPLLVRTGPERRRRALRRIETFFPYFAMRVRFDDRRARARLARAGLRVTPVEAYLPRLIEFARAAEWGRRPLKRRRWARAESDRRSPAR